MDAISRLRTETGGARGGPPVGAGHGVPPRRLRCPCCRSNVRRRGGPRSPRPGSADGRRYVPLPDNITNRLTACHHSTHDRRPDTRRSRGSVEEGDRPMDGVDGGWGGWGSRRERRGVVPVLHRVRLYTRHTVRVSMVPVDLAPCPSVWCCPTHYGRPTDVEEIGRTRDKFFPQQFRPYIELTRE